MKIIAECTQHDFRIAFVATNGPSDVFYKHVHRHALDNVGHQVVVAIDRGQS